LISQFGFPLTHRGQARRITFADRVENGAVIEDGWAG
jgi:hypothetical protein